MSAAGVPFEIKLPDVDEDRIKDGLLDTGAAAGAIATALAEQKAMDVSARAENAPEGPSPSN